MFASVRRFFKRHQNKFVISGAVVGGVYLLTRYTQRKIREWQETEIKAFVERTKKRQHFEQLEETCNNITNTLAAGVRIAIVRELDTRTIIDQLKHGTADKIALWNELKVLSIARSAATIYAYTMLVTFVRIQIDLISGYIYINSTVNNVAGQDVQARYLQLCNYFVSEGVQKLCRLVRSKVEQIAATISLDSQLTLRDLEQMYWSIASSIFADDASDPVKNLANYMILLPDDRSKEASSVYARIIDQTLDLLESEEVQNLTQRYIRSGFALLIDHISVYFGGASKVENGMSQPGTSSSSSQETVAGMRSPRREVASSASTSDNGPCEFVDINKTTLAMAKIIPIVSGQVPDDPTPKDLSVHWLECLVQNNEIKTLGANIYEAISCQTNV